MYTGLWVELELELHTGLSRGTHKCRPTLVLGVCRASSVTLDALKMTATAEKKKKKVIIVFNYTQHTSPSHIPSYSDI